MKASPNFGVLKAIIIEVDGGQSLNCNRYKLVERVMASATLAGGWWMVNTVEF